MSITIYRFQSGGKYKGFNFQEGFLYVRHGNTLMATSGWCSGSHIYTDENNIFVYFSEDDGATWQGYWCDFEYFVNEWGYRVADAFDVYLKEYTDELRELLRPCDEDEDEEEVS